MEPIDFFQLFRTHNKDVKDSSLRTYYYSAKKLHGIFKIPFPSTDLEWVSNENYELLLNETEDIVRRVMPVFMVLLKITGNTELHNKSIQEYRKIRTLFEEENRGKKSLKEEANWLNSEEMKDLIAQVNKRMGGIGKLWTKTDLSKDEHNLLLFYTLLHLVYYCAPLRAEYDSLEILTSAEFHLVPIRDRQLRNFLVHNGRAFTVYLYNHKNSRLKGVYRQQYPPRVTRLFNKLLPKLKTREGAIHLFQKRDGSKFTRQGLSRFIKRMFHNFTGKKPSFSCLRKMYVSSNLGSRASQDKRPILAALLGHSESVQEVTYWK